MSQKGYKYVVLHVSKDDYDALYIDEDDWQNSNHTSCNRFNSKQEAKQYCLDNPDEMTALFSKAEWLAFLENYWLYHAV